MMKPVPVAYPSQPRVLTLEEDRTITAQCITHRYPND